MARGIPSEVLDHFASVPLFQALSKRGLRAVVSAATELDVKAGKTLVREGDTGRELFVITEGTARVTRRGRRLAELGPGDYFGEMALLDHSPRSATVEAQSDMRVMILGPREAEALFDREPGIARPMLATMARRIRNSERSLQH